MNPGRAKITGVVLAGGLARRMGGRDKGLLPFKGRPLVAYALDALEVAADAILINANRNEDLYTGFGYPVINDQTHDFFFFFSRARWRVFLAPCSALGPLTC